MVHVAENSEVASVPSVIAADRHVLSPLVVQGRRSDMVLTRGEGAYVMNAEGARFLDYSSGWVVTTLGHGHPRVVKAIAEQLHRICWAAPNYINDTRARYAEALSAISPWNEGCRTYFTTGGSEGNEAAVAIARRVTGRGKVLAATNSFHGSTAGSAALTGGARRQDWEPYVPGGVARFTAPFPYHSPFFSDCPEEELTRAISHLEGVIAREGCGSIAALIIEPVVASGGVVVYPEHYLQGVRELTRRYGIVLIFDEVITGFGRVGEAFAATRFNVIPDMITFAKAASAAYVPLGGVMVRESLARYFDEHQFPLGQTHAGHPLAMAAGLGTLEALTQDRLLKKGYEIEQWTESTFGTLAARHPSIGCIRGKGAFFAVELVSSRETKRPVVPMDERGSKIMTELYRRLHRRGLMVHGRHNLLLIAPPLTINEAEFRWGAEVIDQELSWLETVAATQSSMGSGN